MRILMIGSGAREHVFVRSFVKSGHAVFAAPGNPGMEADRAECFYNIKDDDIQGLLKLAIRLKIDLTVVGPELPLSLGIVNLFQSNGLSIVGPTQVAAKLESSKIFAKQFMTRHGIPTADYEVCETYEDAVTAIQEGDADPVLKADGLAAGKGVTVCNNYEEALRAADEMMNQGKFGDAGRRILVEKRLKGPECSAIFICDGVHAVPLKKAQDYKRRLDRDQGPNTGGMGAVCPVFEDPVLDQQIVNEIVKLTLNGMATEGNPFQGFLYVGLMLTPTGPKVIEYNVRLGDPEASVIIPMIKDGLIGALIDSTYEGGLKDTDLTWHDGVAVCAVMVSGPEDGGYPGKYETGFPITGIHEAEDEFGVEVYHANTKKIDGQVVTAGGRVLDVVAARVESNEEARRRVYGGVHRISYKNCAFRSDIGQ